MLYKNQFSLTGTDIQNAIIAAAIDRIKFPFERIKFPNGMCQIGWRDLNPPHKYRNIEMGGEPLIGSFDGRKYTLGVFYPSNGNIFADNALVAHPELAQSTVSAEMAHSVDEFLPLTDEQREKLIKLTSYGETTEVHTWWEKQDYEAEYFTLVGEAFMQMFTVAYSDIPFGNAASFHHTLKQEQVNEFLSIMGIQRTDYVAPNKFMGYGKSLVYHTLKHYPLNNGREIFGTMFKDYRPCKICKPK